MQAYFDTQAMHIQRWFRGFWSRKYLHNFAQRKAYLATVAASNAHMRVVAEQEMQISVWYVFHASILLPNALQ